LSKHYKQQHSVKFYADALFITPKYLSQITKEVTGNTAGYLIDEMVMIEAKLLLNNASLSVAQIADELNFADQFVFSKFFKRNNKPDTSEYRRQIS
jgi:AraC-like DNA-binding protein